MCYIHLEEASYEAPLITPPSRHTADTFHLFSNLPFELRVMIWSLAPEARVVEIVYCRNWVGWACPKESYPSPSGLLRANKESRNEYLRHWKHFLPLAPRQIHSPPYCEHNLTRMDQKTYFNPRIDTLYLKHLDIRCSPTFKHELFELVQFEPWIKKIRYLCVELIKVLPFTKFLLNNDWGPVCCKLIPSPQNFSRLEQFLVVIGDNFENDTGLWFGRRPVGVIELRNPSKAHWSNLDAAYALNYYEHFAEAHTNAGNFSWAIKDISRGGRRGMRYWTMNGLAYHMEHAEQRSPSTIRSLQRSYYAHWNLEAACRSRFL